MFYEICCTIIFILLFSIFVNYLLHLRRIRSMPPGPIPFPCIGNLHMISNKPMHIALTNLSEKYGTVFSIRLGMEKYVIINDIETATKTLPLKSFSGRPYNSHYI